MNKLRNISYYGHMDYLPYGNWLSIIAVNIYNIIDIVDIVAVKLAYVPFGS